MSTLKIRGLETVLANLTLFPEELRKQALNPALRAGAAVLQAEAKALAPRRTGKLAGSIAIAKDQRPQLDGMDARYVVYARYKGPEAAMYWRYQEFGTSTNPPQPFMRPAIETKGAAALQAVLQSLVNSVPRIANSLRK